MTRIILPFIDANIIDATITAWYRQPGEPMLAGELLVEVTTDKAAFEIESPADGFLLAIYAQPKSIVPVNYIIGLIGNAGESDPAVDADNAAIMQAYRSQVSTVPAIPPAEASGTEEGAKTTPPQEKPMPGRVRATPKARRLAQSHGIDLYDIQARTGADLITEAILEPFMPK